jgi:hypothetical protein
MAETQPESDEFELDRSPVFFADLQSLGILV